MNRNSQCYYHSALELFLPATVRPEIDGFELQLGKKRYFFRGTETPFNDGSTASIALNKYCTNRLLAVNGIPVPKGNAIHINDYNDGKLEAIIADLSFPLVIKPLLYGALGKDVICNIKTIEQLKKCLDKYPSFHEYVFIEEFHGQLNSYRVLVFKKQIIGIILRFPARVRGDGQHTIQELIDLTNESRKEMNDALGPIAIDEECYTRLNELGIGLDFIPPAGEMILLGYTCNATRGGDFEVLDTKICKENKKLMLKVASSLGLNLVGIDVECVDINLPIESSRGVIIEANHNPSVRIHEFPLKGQPYRVTKKIIRTLIYRHPLSYLGVLYKNKSTALYIRGVIFLALTGVAYYLFGSML